MTEDILLDCSEIDKKFDNVCVNVTHESVYSTLEIIKKEPNYVQNFIYHITLLKLLKFTREEIFKNDNQLRDFSSEVIIFYTTRNILYNIEIPQIKDKKKNEK